MNSIVDPVRTYLQDLEGELKGLAHVNLQERPVHPRDPGLLVKIVPTNSNAASISVHVESANQVDLDIGMGCHAELHSKDSRELVDQLREVIESVVNGGFEETARRKGGRIVRATGILSLPNGQRTIRYWSLGALLTFGRTDRIDQRYEPYQPQSESS